MRRKTRLLKVSKDAGALREGADNVVSIRYLK